MVSFNCNEPAVTGYSACWAANLMTIHAHRDGEDMAFYKDFDACSSRAIWVYMPVDPGELISEIWARCGRQYGHMGLMVSAARDIVISC